jgi:translation initiation factor 2 alpha subunit (eIF-2alpha)
MAVRIRVCLQAYHKRSEIKMSLQALSVEARQKHLTRWPNNQKVQGGLVG